jgi:dimethylglycine dehydrogenase
VKALTRETPTLHDNDAEYYMRQEHDGFLFGAYERGGVHWAVDGTPLDFDTELLPNHLDRIAKNYELACERVPVLATAGVKSVVNGPMVWSPDVSPIVGPVPGIPTYWMAVGIMAGFSQSAGIGKVLADWIIDGQTEADMGSIDVARFGPWADADYAYQRGAENYSTRYRI